MRPKYKPFPAAQMFDAIDNFFGRSRRLHDGPTIVIVSAAETHRVDEDGALWLDGEKVHDGPVEIKLSEALPLWLDGEED